MGQSTWEALNAWQSLDCQRDTPTVNYRESGIIFTKGSDVVKVVFHGDQPGSHMWDRLKEKNVEAGNPSTKSVVAHQQQVLWN